MFEVLGGGRGLGAIVVHKVVKLLQNANHPQPSPLKCAITALSRRALPNNSLERTLKTQLAGRLISLVAAQLHRCAATVWVGV